MHQKSKPNDTENRASRSGQKDLKNQATRFLEERKSQISGSCIQSPYVNYNNEKINMMPLEVSPNVL
jgi:hypothetical protein